MNILKEALTQGSYNSTNVSDFSMSTFEVTIYVLNSLFGFPTHSYVLWLIVRGITSEIFTFNISVCEIMVCVRSVIGVISHTFPGLRDIGSFLTGFATNGRFFQCLICVERYLAVVHPVTFLKYKPLRYRVACCTLVWIMIFLSCLLNLLLEKPGYLDFHLFTCLYISQILVFLSVQLFCCLAVLRALKQSGPGEKGREEENHMKRTAFHLILITTVTLLITYIPGCIIVFLQLLSIRFPAQLSSVGQSCFMLAGFVQPLLYIHRVKKLHFCRSY